MENQEYRKKVLMKATGITLAVIGVLGIVYGLASWSKPEPLPEKFTSGYRKVAEESGDIADIVNSIASNIEEINDMDVNNKTDQALSLIDDTKRKSKEAHDKSVALIDDLEGITKVALEIESDKQKEKVLEAIRAEVMLVKELVGYTSNIDDFLKSLSIAVVSDNKSDRLMVERNLRAVNVKRQTINNLNSMFLAKVEQLGVFD